MKIYNRLTNKFEDFSNQEFYLTIKVDELRSDKLNIITLICTQTKLELPLNSEDDFDNIKAVELFRQEDRSFANHVDFFINDNPSSLKEILNN